MIRLIIAYLCLWGSALPALGQGAPVTLQWFETSWETMEDRTADAFAAGYARVWAPPPSKAEGGTGNVGYAVFDRFDLGSSGSPTRYGTEAAMLAAVAEQDKAAISTYIDLILNHNGFSDNGTPGFEASGDYPGFVLSFGGDPWGDFHDPSASGDIEGRLLGLIDIAQEKNHQLIRHPVTPGDPQNIPAGTTYDLPDPSNRQFYADLGLPANSIGIYPFNVADPMAGDAVAENATGLLLRHVRWLIEVVGVDGFRIDAMKHVPDWFYRDFYDRHVWQRGKPDLADNPTTPFCFGEAVDGSWTFLDDWVCKGTTGNCNPSGGVTGNRDVLDFPLVFALTNELNGTGFGTWHNIVNSSVDGIFDGNPNDGDFGVQFVDSHDNVGAVLSNVAYCYILTRTGLPIIYFRAGEFGNPAFPKPGRHDALGGQLGSLLTTLVDIHNEYARDTYLQRSIDGDVLVFERNNACLVGLNDRNDNGYDSRTVSTNFAEGLRLHELTGNATHATVDPNGDIFDVVTVGASGQVTIRVPRNKNVNGVTHGRSYVVYGPVNPDGDLTLTNVAQTIPADPPGSNATQRLTPIEVIQGDSFEVKLETDDGDPLDPGEDDLAKLRMDAGLDVNGNGDVDVTSSAAVDYGFEDFLTESVSLESGGVDVGGGVFRGRYRQVIDATQLSEGRHYLSVIAFRSRPGGTPPIFETWRKVLLIDRVPPQVALADPEPGTPITSAVHTFAVRSVDRTANKVHIFLDQSPGTDVVALAELGQGLATQTDRDRFERLLTGLGAGHHRLDVVAYEETRPDPSVTTFTGILVEINGFNGLGDMNGNGAVTNRDIWPFVQMVQAGGQFSPAGDVNGDGVVDANDEAPFAELLAGAGTLQGGPSSPLTATPEAPAAGQSLFWLQENGAVSQLGSVTNPDITLIAGQSAPLYVWFNKDSAANGFDGVSLDVRMKSTNGGLADATIVVDEPLGRWYGATAGTARTDSGGDGVDDANAFDLTNTDTFTDAPGRYGTIDIMGVADGTVTLFLHVGALGIADGGNNAIVWFGLANGSTSPEQLNISGGVSGLASFVAEATIHVVTSVPGDFDFDTDVDQKDFGHLQACLLGPTIPQTDPDCEDASLDGDEYVSDADVAIFMGCLSGANIPADPGCAN